MEFLRAIPDNTKDNSRLQRGKSSLLRTQKHRRGFLAMLYVLPTVALLLVFNYYPVVTAFIYSFTNWNGFNPPQFVGIGNFVEMFTSPDMASAYWHMFWLTLASLVITLTIPLIVAEFIYKVASGGLQAFYRLLFVIPMVVPTMVILLLWQFLLNPDVGLVNAVLQALGVPSNHLPLWLASPQSALPSLVLIGFPWVSGVAVLIYLAGFQGITREVIESARVDGATGFRLFFQIELPLIFSQIKLMLILTIIGSLQAFQTQLVLTGGGPGTATTVPGLIMYQAAMEESRLGYGSAIGFVLFLVIFALTIINNRYVKSSSTEYQA